MNVFVIKAKASLTQSTNIDMLSLCSAWLQALGASCCVTGRIPYP